MRCSRPNARAWSTASATRSAVRRSRSMSSAPSRRGAATPISMTPITSPCATSGTPTIDVMPVSSDERLGHLLGSGVVEHHRAARRQDAPGEPGIGRDAPHTVGIGHAVVGDERQIAVVLEQQQRCGVGAEDVARASEDRRRERVEVALRQPGVGDGLQARDRDRRAFGLLTRGLGAHELLAFTFLAQTVADVRQAGVEHELAVALDDPDHRLALQQACRPAARCSRAARGGAGSRHGADSSRLRRRSSNFSWTSAARRDPGTCARSRPCASVRAAARRRR